ncbi:hypothetical protein FSP39_014963 [Pinctada imbricata]|uniref:G-protein coupled receptors family 1 profile domain-containing protein n=1 Tax=Pinctada imbricata TaxID=66713 RepID=A0AA88YDN7_PINIB|nr:hypothetical protein FSP39_014963 [Pinctada imbricata]
METNRIIALIFLGLFSIVGTMGNSIVIRFYITHLKTALDVFIAALACVDLITCVFILPFTMVMEAVDHEIHQKGLCQFYYFLVTSNVPFSVLLMVIIAIDRYLLINRPHLHVLNVRRAIITVCALVGFVCVLGLLTTFTIGLGSLSRNETDVHENITQIVYGNDVFGVIANRTENTTITFPHLHVRYIESLFCDDKSDVFGQKFSASWKVVYASIYGIALFIVIVLYSMVYKEIIAWRRKRSRLLSSSQQGSILHRHEHEESKPEVSKQEVSTGKTSPTAPLSENILQRPSRMIGAVLRNKQFYQNSKTAFMLFSVTAIFVVVFLPAFLMMNAVIDYEILVYYMYFSYNVANPFVYATLNGTFRTYVKQLLSRRCSKGQTSPK